MRLDTAEGWRTDRFSEDMDSPGFHREAVGLVDQSLLQTRTICSDSAGIATLSHRHPERTLGHRDLVKQDLDQVQTCRPTEIRPSYLQCCLFRLEQDLDGQFWTGHPRTRRTRVSHMKTF